MPEKPDNTQSSTPVMVWFRDDVRAFVPEASEAGSLFGKSYLEPIVDHRAARERALKAFAGLKS